MYKHSKATSDDSSVSRACLNAGNQNARCNSALQRELRLLEKQQSRRVSNIHHEAKQFRHRFADRSPSPSSRPASAVNARTGSAVPRKLSASLGSPARALSASLGSPARLDSSPGASPPSSPPLSVRRRSSSARHAGRVQQLASSATSSSADDAVCPPPSVTMATKSDSSLGAEGGAVPQIIVSDDAAAARGAKAGRDSSGSPQGSNHSHSPDGQGLVAPTQRLRSNSMPSAMMLPPLYKQQPPARRPSHFQDPDGSADHLRVESPRSRSSSFSGIEPVRRRGSIAQQWGSISERQKPAMGNLRGRRGSMDMDSMLRDLMYGVQHTELMDRRLDTSSISDRQWQDLRQCRYLRMPSKQSSEEDISEEAGPGQ